MPNAVFCRFAESKFLSLGADATIFPNRGGRFSYSRETCLAIAAAALAPLIPGSARVAFRDFGDYRNNRLHPRTINHVRHPRTIGTGDSLVGGPGRRDLLNGRRRVVHDLYGFRRDEALRLSGCYLYTAKLLHDPPLKS